MPRSSGARTSAKAPTRSAPAPARQAPPPAQRQAPPPAAAAAPPPMAAPAAGGGMMSGMMGSMASGMAAGVGMSMASRAVDSMMGPRQTEVVHRNEGAPAAPAATGNLCSAQNDQLKQCMNTSADSSQCQYYMDSLKACQQQQ
mmetsp:Transcript_95880/g.172991  ORF Transcript_95880/g.172991 Transcript_95880/m.172991 type:complete len:143 (+) Transcript_95880:87-515(+)